MGEQKTIHALILEEDKSVVNPIKEALETRSYKVSTLSKREEALSLLQEKQFPLAVIGNTEGTNSEIASMKELVKTSPMTSVILLSDLTEKDVHEKTEGYGILGHINRNVPLDGLFLLVDRFEEIFKTLALPGTE